MLFVKGYVLGDFALGHEATNAGPARFGHLLADLQMLLSEAQDIGLRGGKLGRDRNLLLDRKRNGGKFPLDGFDMRSRSDARGHRAVMHVDRTMDVENRRRVSDFALRDTHRNDCAAVFDGLAIDIRLMFMNIGSEQPMPQASFFHARRQARSASLEAG